MDRPVRIMFVYTRNSARSQMAEAFARVLGQGGIEAQSAGVEPKGLNPNAVRVMQERGIDISGQRSNALDYDEASRMDYLITVCGNADERCPVLPAGVVRIHWPLEDPAAGTGSPEYILEIFRRTRDEIEARVRDLLETAGSLRPRICLPPREFTQEFLDCWAVAHEPLPHFLENSPLCHEPVTFTADTSPRNGGSNESRQMRPLLDTSLFLVWVSFYLFSVSWLSRYRRARVHALGPLGRTDYRADKDIGLWLMVFVLGLLLLSAIYLVTSVIG